MMNQFAQLLSSENQQPILLDTCTIIAVHERRQEALELRKKIASRRDIRILVPRILIREVAKVAPLNEQEALALIESFSQKDQIDYLSNHKDEEINIQIEANALITKYYRYCHYPDNQYLAYCKEHGAVLVTYDNGLRKVARIEGIMTCSPGNFRMYQ